MATTATRHAGDICPDCEIIRLPGALCPLHAAAPAMAALLRRYVDAKRGVICEEGSVLDMARALLALLGETR